MPVSNIMTQFNDNVPALSAAGRTEKPDGMNRFMGGANRLNHPYISGYWYFLLNPPDKIFGGASADVQQWLHSTAESFTPPSKNLNKVDVPGMGGVSSSFVSGQTLNRTFTVAFREYSDVPILSIIDKWTSLMDPRLGISPLENFTAKEYKGTAAAILTKPQATGTSGSSPLTLKDIEQVYFFDGVFPETSPHDSFASDIAANDVTQLSITFSFDGWPLTNEVKGTRDAALTLINQAKGFEQAKASAFTEGFKLAV